MTNDFTCANIHACLDISNDTRGERVRIKHGFLIRHKALLCLVCTRVKFAGLIIYTKFTKIKLILSLNLRMFKVILRINKILTNT